MQEIEICSFLIVLENGKKIELACSRSAIDELLELIYDVSYIEEL